MSVSNNLRAGWGASGTATNGSATATKAAVTNQSHYVTSICVTYSGVVAAATTVTLSDGTMTLTFEVPASVAAAPNVPLVVPFWGGLKMATGAAVTLTAGAGGAGIVGAAVMTGYTAE